ncbi:MAG: protein-glutamine glutaminase family protein [Bdellovibrionales bacterium]
MKNMKLGLVLFILLASQLVLAGRSAVRQKGESFRAAAKRTAFMGQVPSQQPQMGQTPWDRAQDLTKINFKTVSNLGNTEDLQTIFSYVRDTRFIENFQSPKQRRKISWNYPDDGCFVRAEMMARKTLERRMPPVMKLFVFGNLAVRSQNHPDQIVRWWYHVAPVYRVGSTVYVLDPAIEPRRPLTVLEWRQRVSEESDIRQFALCSTHSFDPDDGCDQPRQLDDDYLEDYQRQYQNFEWDRILYLGRDPYREL